MDALSFDTTFLIDFQRERKARQGRAHSFLEAHRECPALLSVVAWGEFAEGFARLDDPVLLSVVDSFALLPVTEATAGLYAGVVRGMRRTGNLIGANDLWIACGALEREVPLVTGNVEHFARVPGLMVRSY